MKPDWRQITSLIREDLRRTGMTQSAYGAPFNLGQSQISGLVRGTTRELTKKIEELLLARFKMIPGLSDEPVAIEDEIAGVMTRVEAEIRRALRNAPAERHARIIEHIEGQVTLLADLASAGAIVESVPTAPRAQSPAKPAATGSLRREKTIATGEARRRK